MSRGKIQQEASQFFAYRMREPNGSHFSDGGMIGLTQLLCHPQSNFAVLTKEVQKVLTMDKICLGWLNYFCRELVRLFSNSGRQSEDLPGICDSHDQRFPIGGSRRQFYSTAAQDEHAARHLPFN